MQAIYPVSATNFLAGYGALCPGAIRMAMCGLRRPSATRACGKHDESRIGTCAGCGKFNGKYLKWLLMKLVNPNKPLRGERDHTGPPIVLAFGHSPNHFRQSNTIPLCVVQRIPSKCWRSHRGRLPRLGRLFKANLSVSPQSGLGWFDRGVHSLLKYRLSRFSLLYITHA